MDADTHSVMTQNCMVCELILPEIETQTDRLKLENTKLRAELEQAIAERTPHDYCILADQRDEYKRMLVGAIEQVEKERAEVQRLKDHVPGATKMIRPEPSRLEIAAMLLGAQPPPQAGSFSGQSEHALKRADALIAAAKDGK